MLEMYNSRKKWLPKVEKFLLKAECFLEGFESGCYVKPAIAEADNAFEIVQHETLLLYLIKIFGNGENAIASSKQVAQVIIVYR
jgi:aldehyde dehydrogenase (NAD+)